QDECGHQPRGEREKEKHGPRPYVLRLDSRRRVIIIDSLSDCHPDPVVAGEGSPTGSWMTLRKLCDVTFIGEVPRSPQRPRDDTRSDSIFAPPRDMRAMRSKRAPNFVWLPKIALRENENTRESWRAH